MIARIMGYAALLTCTAAGVAALLTISWAAYIQAQPAQPPTNTTALTRAIELRCIREAQHEKDPTVWVRKIKTCQRQLLKEAADEKPQP